MHNTTTRRSFLSGIGLAACGLATGELSKPILAAAKSSDFENGLYVGKEPFRHVVGQATDQFRRHTEGDMVRLKDGRWLMAYTRFEKAADTAQAEIVSLTSADGGKTWSKPVVLQKNVGKKNVMSVSLLRLASGKIIFVYLRKNSLKDCVPYLRVSADEARTWSEPVRVTPDDGYHVLNNARVVQLSTGRLIAPVCTMRNVWKPGDHGVTWCYFSDDEGKTWRKGKGCVDLPKRGAMEPGVVEKRDGSVFMILRTQLGRVYVCTSADGGDTFSKAKPSPVVAPESPATISKIPQTKDWLLVFNHNYEEGAGHCGRRTPLTTAISKDEGKTWGHYRNLEPDPKKTYAYTSIRYDKRNVHLTYYENVPGAPGPSHVHTIVPVEWLYA